MERSVMDMITDEKHKSIIKVVGVGSFGVRALNYMYERGIQGVDFFVCNTEEFKALIFSFAIPTNTT